MDKMSKVCLSSNNGPKAVGPYSLAVRGGEFVFCSGMIGIDPASGEMVSGGIKEQTRQALANLRTILKDNGLGMEAVVKTTCFLTDMGKFGEFNEIYAEFFGQSPPARSTVEVAALPKGALVEVEAVAVCEK
jgi:2-iminobutanoate/2-iminopropanoate deaminase